jgi:polyhydroxybutyrate depolymerase
LSHAGAERTFILHLPSNYDPTRPWPLVFNFHGRTPSFLGKASALQNNVSMLSDKGQASGFVVVNPQGLSNAGGEQTWNGGDCCSDDPSRDDVGFVDALLDRLEAELCIDSKRIYAAGLSNGGYLSHRLACERAERFAAIAPVASSNRMPSCNPTRAISVISFNGTSDALVGYASAVASNDAWVSRNGCTSTPVETFSNGDSRCDSYAGCTDGGEIVLCTVDEGGHTWPGGTDLPGLGKTTQDLIANDALWDFFEAHPLP